MKTQNVSLLVILFAVATCAHAARVYKWTDSSGVHYSDRPPDSSTRRRIISVEGSAEPEASQSNSAKRRRHSPNQPRQSHEDVERRKRQRASRKRERSRDISVRTIDGGENNSDNPDWGRADTAFIRLTSTNYGGDGSGVDPSGENVPPSEVLPNARAISNVLVLQHGPILNSAGASDFVWQWGQFIDHDIDLTPTIEPAEPFDISIPAGDPYFISGGAMPLDRSLYAQPAFPIRQQLNLISAYIDASNVYGSDPERASELRAANGRLKTSIGDLLPFNHAGLENAGGTTSDLFLAGDVRANEVAGLTAMHTLFVREHNYWANRFHREKPRLSSEQIYQMARMMVAAELQLITYQEFLPILLGPDALDPYNGYQPDVNPGVSNEFATAAFRFGHSMVSPELLRIDDKGNEINAGHLPVRDAFFNPREIRNVGIDSLLRGLAFNLAQEIDVHLIEDLRSFLFGPPPTDGFDLATLNIQRGRDHGLQSYNETRRQLPGLTPVTVFSDVSSDPGVQASLSRVYESVDDIDLWVGVLAEDHVPGALVGETAHTILKDQFERLRDGDRYWYEIYLPRDLLGIVRRQTLAKVIRRNTEIGAEIQDNVFIASDSEARNRGGRRSITARSDPAPRRTRPK